MSALSEVEEDFIGETLDILTDLCRSCGELKGAGSADDRWRNIQRGLHTIKGNSPAFGFEEFGEMASGLLERLKAESGTQQERMNLAPLVLEFVTRSRQYLGLVREGRCRPFFGGIFKSLRDQLEEEPAPEPPDTEAAHEGPTRGGRSEDESSRGGDAMGNGGRRGPKSGSSLTAKLAAILASAPPVKPNLEQLAKLAARRLRTKSDRASVDERPRRTPASPKPEEEERTEPTRREPTRRESTRKEPTRKEPLVEDRGDAFASDVVPTAAGPVESAAPTSPPEIPIACSEAAPAPVTARVSSSEVAGLAFEALCAEEAASMVRAEIDQSAALNHQMTRVTDFLADFGRWAREQQMIPLQDSLDRCVEDLREQAGLEIEIAVEGTSRLVLPLLGELAGQAITELIFGLSPPGKRGGAARSLKLSVPESSGRAEIRISGAGAPAALAMRLRVYPVKRRLEEIGGDLVTGSPGEDLVVILPDDIHSLDVCLLRSGASHVGVPGHRVIGTTMIQPGDVTIADSECRCRYENEEIGALDLTDSSMGEAGDGASERCLVVLRGGGGHRGLIVDELLGQGEMLVLLNAGSSRDGDIVGSCYEASEERTVPLLDIMSPR